MKVNDPVCGLDIESQQASGQAVYGGTTYYFCSAQCLQKFNQHPERYARRDDPAKSKPKSVS